MNKQLILRSTLKQRLIAAGVILLLLAFLLYKLMLAPYADNFNSLHAQLKAQKNLLSLKMLRAENLVRLNEEYQKYEQELKEIDKNFFTEKESEEFMKKLPKIVSGFGNQVVLLQPRSKSRDDGLKLRQVDLEAAMEGQFEGILSLLNWFDKYNKIIKLEKVSINTSEQTIGIETRFTLNIYVID